MPTASVDFDTNSAWERSSVQDQLVTSFFRPRTILAHRKTLCRPTTLFKCARVGKQKLPMQTVSSPGTSRTEANRRTTLESEEDTSIRRTGVPDLDEEIEMGILTLKHVEKKDESP